LDIPLEVKKEVVWLASKYNPLRLRPKRILKKKLQSLLGVR